MLLSASRQTYPTSDLYMHAHKVIPISIGIFNLPEYLWLWDEVNERDVISLSSQPNVTSSSPRRMGVAKLGVPNQAISNSIPGSPSFHLEPVLGQLPTETYKLDNKFMAYQTWWLACSATKPTNWSLTPFLAAPLWGWSGMLCWHSSCFKASRRMAGTGWGLPLLVPVRGRVNGGQQGASRWLLIILTMWRLCNDCIFDRASPDCGALVDPSLMSQTADAGCH